MVGKGGEDGTRDCSWTNLGTPRRTSEKEWEWVLLGETKLDETPKGVWVFWTERTVEEDQRRRVVHTERYHWGLDINTPREGRSGPRVDAPVCLKGRDRPHLSGIWSQYIYCLESPWVRSRGGTLDVDRPGKEVKI